MKRIFRIGIFTAVGVVYGTEEMTNAVTVTYTGGTATAADTTAQAAYGPMETTIDSLLASSSDADALASWIVSLYSNPQYRLDQISVNMLGLTSGQRLQVLMLDLGDAVTVVWTPNNVGAALTQVVSIDSIAHDASQGGYQHTVTFALSQTTAAFLLDSDTFGLLDISALGF